MQYIYEYLVILLLHVNEQERIRLVKFTHHPHWKKNKNIDQLPLIITIYNNF